jgi:hypothetical protein
MHRLHPETKSTETRTKRTNNRTAFERSGTAPKCDVSGKSSPIGSFPDAFVAVVAALPESSLQAYPYFGVASSQLIFFRSTVEPTRLWVAETLLLDWFKKPMPFGHCPRRAWTLFTSQFF